MDLEANQDQPLHSSKLFAFQKLQEVQLQKSTTSNIPQTPPGSADVKLLVQKQDHTAKPPTQRQNSGCEHNHKCGCRPLQPALLFKSVATQTPPRPVRSRTESRKKLPASTYLKRKPTPLMLKFHAPTQTWVGPGETPPGSVEVRPGELPEAKAARMRAEYKMLGKALAGFLAERRKPVITDPPSSTDIVIEKLVSGDHAETEGCPLVNFEEVRESSPKTPRRTIYEPYLATTGVRF